MTIESFYANICNHVRFLHSKPPLRRFYKLARKDSVLTTSLTELFEANTSVNGHAPRSHLRAEREAPQKFWLAFGAALIFVLVLLVVAAAMLTYILDEPAPSGPVVIIPSATVVAGAVGTGL